MRKKNKLFSALLAVLFLLSAMSVTAFAADGGNTTLTTTIPCTVTLQVGDHGKVTVNSTDYTGDASFTEAVGTALTYTFTPNTLYKVDKVIYNGTDVTGELSGNAYTAPALAGNAALSVSFRFLGIGEDTIYKVTFHANGHGTAPASQTVLSGYKAAEPTAPTTSGWTFGGWYKDSACTETQKYDFNTPVTANLDLYAKWIVKSAVFPFTDVKEADWSYEDIAYVYEKGLMQGTSATTFAPQLSTSRAMIVTILYRLAGEPAVSGTCPFTDVKSGSYYEKATTWAAANKIVSGYGDGKFGADDPITREQMATILYRFAEFMGYDVSAKANLSGYTDAGNISAYAKDALAWANAKGLVTGTSATTLSPKGSATREQVAAILHRFCENIVK